MNKDQR